MVTETVIMEMATEVVTDPQSCNGLCPLLRRTRRRGLTGPGASRGSLPFCL